MYYVFIILWILVSLGGLGVCGYGLWELFKDYDHAIDKRK